MEAPTPTVLMTVLENTYDYREDVCMVVTDSKSKDQPGKVANAARGLLNRENIHFFPPRSRL